MEFQRRLPAKTRKISEIKPEDIRVAVTGTIIGRQGSIIVLDDGSGKVNASFEEPIKFNENQLVRIFGRVMPLEQGVELQGEIIQDMQGLDLELKKKLEGLEA
jgi:hypothetical protein